MTKDTILVAELFHYPFLINICMKLFNLKETKKQEIESFLQKEKHKLVQMEKFSLEKNKNFAL